MAEVAILDVHRPDAEPQRLTDFNGPLLARRQLAVPREHWVEAADGHRVHVWAMLPPSAPTGRSPAGVPAILQIHGGPQAQYCSTFFHEFQVLAAAGYAVFYSNPRGSKGYGRDHCRAIHGRWGTDDWTDIQAVIAFMKSHPAVDPRRMGVMGGSYGGYMTNWVISHCDDFIAAVSDRGLTNLVSFSGNVDVVEPPDFFFPGNFWDQAEARWNQSPLKYAANVRAATLLIHSEGDLRVTIEQAEQFYAALKLLGVPARFARYPRSTSHGMSRGGPPDLRIHRLHEILRWWKEHLSGAGIAAPRGRARSGRGDATSADASSRQSAKSGTFGTRLSLFFTVLTSFGTLAASAGPPVFRGETAGVARNGTIWHSFAKRAAGLRLVGISFFGVLPIREAVRRQVDVENRDGREGTQGARNFVRAATGLRLPTSDFRLADPSFLSFILHFSSLIARRRWLCSRHYTVLTDDVNTCKEIWRIFSLSPCRARSCAVDICLRPCALTRRRGPPA